MSQPYPSSPQYGQQYGQQYPQQQYPQNPNQMPYNPSYNNNQNQNIGWNQQQGYGQQTPSAPTAPPPTYDPEDGLPKSNLGFSERSIRQAFIRKVFTLVAIMLAIVAIMTAIPFIDTSGNFKQSIQNKPWIYYVSYAIFFVVYIVLICVEKARRTFPINLVMAGILALSIGYMTMTITSFYDIESVLICLVILVVCCTLIIAFACQTKYDLTSCIGVLVVLGLVIFVIGIVAIVVLLVFHVRWLYMLYAGLAALLFMAYLAVDVQLVMGGRKYEISPEEYIFAAIQIFLDIIYIFWMLLAIFGRR